MEHSCHEHSLILNQNYIARQGDVCYRCKEEIVSCTSYIYSCSRSSSNSSTGTTSTGTSQVDPKCDKFLLHKPCAKLPHTIKNPFNKNEFLVFCVTPRKKQTLFQLEYQLPGDNCLCSICDIQLLYSYCNSDFKFCICLKCAIFQEEEEEEVYMHPAHSHGLAFILRPSSFRCEACNKEESIRDMSYKCNRCPFWIHKSCGDAPITVLLYFHLQHPLFLSFSRRQQYHKYPKWCILCDEKLNQKDWVYECKKCKVFIHFNCVRTSRSMLRSTEHETHNSDLVRLPAADESSLNQLVEQFVKSMINNSFSSKDQNPEMMHWSHNHPLKLITNNELNDQQDDDRIVLLCDGCVKPIRTDGDLFYSCVCCNYSLHKICAEVPVETMKKFLPGKLLHAKMYTEPYKFFICDCCGAHCNGMFFTDTNTPSNEGIKLHIGCGNLPETIKHEAHRHQLHQVFSTDHACNACGINFHNRRKYCCERCDFYICEGCNMKAKTVMHPWDPHPLELIYEAAMVKDHDYEFNCEFCSEEINANCWFYHCSVCDLSFHLEYCLEMACYRYYSNVKFGATDIVIRELHHHSLRFVLNKKVRSCQECHSDKQLGKPVLECTQCNALFCMSCAQKGR